MGKSHFVIALDSNGQPKRFHQKPWVRNNIGELNRQASEKKLPSDYFQPGHTSRANARHLKKLGWRMEETEDAVFVIQPDLNNQTDYAEPFIEEVEEESDSEILPDSEDAVEFTFSLERDLQAAIRKNIEALESGLTILDGGTERTTKAGRIDILACDKSGTTVVIELKAVEAKQDVITQILAYMQAVRMEDQTNVRGIIIAKSFPERVKLAAREIPQLTLIEYSFQFRYNSIQ